MSSKSNPAFVPGDYPAARRDETVREDHFGRIIADPYRWLEDPDAEETKTFVEEQNKRTFKYLESHPKREAIMKRLTTLNDFPKFGCPFRRGDYYYQFRNSGLQAQSIMYQLKSLDSEPVAFLDPNTLEADGTAALSTYSFTHSGKLFAYGISCSGSDWVTVHVKETKPGGKTFEDAVEWCKFTGLSWTHDDKGFFYNRYPKPMVGHDKAGTETGTSSNAMLYYHKLGTPQSEDIMVYMNPKNPDHNYAAEISDDGNYLLMTTHPSCDPVNKLYIAKFTDKGIKGDNVDFEKVIDNFDAEYDYITNEGTMFTFKTNLSSPRYKVVKLDLANVDSGFADVIPEKKEVLDSVICVNQNKLVVVYNEDVKHVLRVHDLSSGKFLQTIPLEIGTISSLTGRKEDEECFFNTVSFLSPGTIKRHDFKTGKTSVFLETRVKEYDPSKFMVKQIFYDSKDGTKIPMFLISRKDMQPNGKNPTLLYGYGGFSVSIMPSFAFSWIAFAEHMSGVVAVANIRGGGEYGEDWHKAGIKDKKQNVFDDFQYAAKYLIREKYANPSTIAINGGSNGGLLIGACINQTPDLFGAACADVGVLDMCRFHKFTIGHAWRSDYGDPDIKEDLEHIMKYSPLHNIRGDAVYPTTLLTTGDHDDRVVPLHSLKFIAELQHKAKMNANPLLIRVEMKAGHGAGKPTQKRIEEAADKLSFYGLALNADWKE